MQEAGLKPELLLRGGLYGIGLIYGLLVARSTLGPLLGLAAVLALYLAAARFLHSDGRSTSRFVMAVTEAVLLSMLVHVADGGRGPGCFLLPLGALFVSLDLGITLGITYACVALLATLGPIVTAAQASPSSAQLLLAGLLTALGGAGGALRPPPAANPEDRRTQALALQKAHDAARASSQARQQQEQELFEERRKLEALMEVARRMALLRRPEELLQTITTCALEQMQVEGALVMLRRGEELVVEWSEGISQGACQNLRCRVGEGLLGRLAASGEGFLFSQLDDRGRLQSLGPLGGMEGLLQTGPDGGFSPRPETFRCFLVAPLLSPQDRQPMGLLLVANRLRADRFTAHDLGYLQILATNAAISLRNLSFLGELERSHYEMIQALAQAIEAKDSYTHGHVARVRQYSVQLARAMGLNAQFIEDVDKAALLHDVGKISTPDRVLLKEGPLDDAEFAIMKQHASESVRILRDIRSVSAEVQAMVLHHHERWDGKGYPAGIKGDEIPLGAQIISVADCYDAMTSDRPYRKGFAPVEALQRMESGAGTQFNIKILACFFALSNYLPQQNEQLRSLTQQANSIVGANLLRLPEPSRASKGILVGSEAPRALPETPRASPRRLEIE